MNKRRWIAGIVALLFCLGTVTAVYAFTYQVQWGDTLWGLSRRFGPSIDEIARANNLANPNFILAGQTLEIPDGTTPVPPTVTPAPPTVTPPPGEGFYYTVLPGDTVYGIARRFGVSVNAIIQANNLWNPNLIFAGQQLFIPGANNPNPNPPGTPVPNPTVTPGPQPQSMALGGQSVNLANKDRMSSAGMTWIKVQYKWTPGDAANIVAGNIQEAHDNGFKILLSITGEQTYPTSIDFGGYVNFIRDVAALGPDGIEVWNEQNIDFEWPAGQINPTTYVNSMLAPAYNAIKGVNNNILVISGALAPTGFDNTTNAWSDSRYLASMRAAGAANYMDCVGMHYNAGATAPSQITGHPADSGAHHYSWYFGPTLDLYANTFAGTDKVCITELGYLSPEGFPGVPQNFEWAANTSAAEQAQWLAEAVQLARFGNRVQMVIIYNVDFIKYELSGDPQAGYAIIRPDGSCPACEALAAIK